MAGGKSFSNVDNLSDIVDGSSKSLFLYINNLQTVQNKCVIRILADCRSISVTKMQRK